MNVGELKTIVAELKRNIELSAGSQKAILLVSRLTEILGVLDDERIFLPEMMEPIKEIIHRFWNWVIHNLPPDKWQNDITVAPWLSFQRSLAKINLLERDFHHPMLYQKLKNHYDSIPNNQLGITELLLLLMRTSRLLGYAERKELDHYPLVTLHELLEAKRPHEGEKIKDILFLLRSIFYLTYTHCTVEQLDLLPSLIFFRYRTTDEERRSELAILNWLTKNTSDCLEFFSANNGYIDIRSLRVIDCLQSVAHLIPAERNDFFRVTNENRWIYQFIQKSRVHRESDESELLNETLRSLKRDFSTKRDPSFLDFTNEVKRQMRTLTRVEARLVHSALYLFTLDHYVTQRTEDQRHRHSLLSFSGTTKCHAAEKRKLAIYGTPVRLGFFEALAIKQGRLKRLLEPLEHDALVLSIS